MFTFLTFLAVIVCVLLILFILIQNPKGGGLSASFGASNQIMGVQKTGDFLEKATWGLSIALLVICLSMKLFSPGSGTHNQPLEIQKQLQRSQGGASNGNTNTPAPGNPNGANSPTSPSPANSPAAVPGNSKP